MNDVLLNFATSSGFLLSGVATAHGWHALAPYRWDVATGTLHRIEDLPGGVTHLAVTQPDGILVRAGRPLSPDDKHEVERRLRWSLRLDENLDAFTTLCAREPALSAAVLPSGGRLLRCPTLWEDTVKTILTTNTTWAQTKVMAARLVTTLAPHPPGNPSLRAFPAPEAVAVAGEDVFKEQIRLGYRNASVLRIARTVAEGRVDLEGLKDYDLPTHELRKRLLALPGVGPYAAATLLMLLGRYEELGIDTELRSHVSRKYFNGEAVTEKDMRAVYEHWGQWRYLAYWFDPR